MIAPHPLDETGLRLALEQLANLDADVRLALDQLGYPAPRVRPAGFVTLLQAIVSQQISTKAAAAIWTRIELACGQDGVSPQTIGAMDEAALRTCGLSGRKAAYALGLTDAILSGQLDPSALAAADDEAAIAAISALRGFGRWSAEIYLLFALGRKDVFPADDLAIQIGYQRLKGLSARPTAKALRVLVEPWAPLRGAGAILLWRVYGSATFDMVPPVP